MRNLSFVVMVAFLVAGCPVQAASRVLKAGERAGIGEDVVLSGDDVFEINGTADKPCRIDGNSNVFKSSAKWTGHIKLTHCEIRGFGSAQKPAFDVTASGAGDKVIFEHCDFSAARAVHIANNDQSATIFRHNRLRDNSMVPVTNLPSESAPIFRASGSSMARKLFQGNRVEKSIVTFERAGNWLIGGDSDADSNIITGLRGSLSIHNCPDTTVRGNYIHADIPSFRWSQVHTLAVQAPCPNLVVEHNIIRHGQWVVRGLTGEFRYNLVLDADGHNFIIGPAGKCHMHHNIFARYCTIDPNLGATIGVIYKAEDIQIYNNTFDGGGKDLERVWHVPAVEVGSDGFVHSLRNNAFCNHPTRRAGGPALVRAYYNEKHAAPPERLGYADFNLFFNPDAADKQNYALAVKGKIERQDAGFGKNDVPVGGARNAQADPRFAGPIPKKFPFGDDDIRAGKVTVSRILAHYRAAYAPAEGSPLTAAGDPADGNGSFIGAVGAGKDLPADRFGKFGTPTK